MPKASSGSLSSGESTWRSCNKCHGRMSSFSPDEHLFCIKCRGSECSVTSRCDECFEWTKEEMESYVRLRKSLTSKNRKSKTPHSSSSPRSTAPDGDFDHKMAAQFDSFHKAVDKKLEDMSSALMSKFSIMLAQFQSGLYPSSVSDETVVPGYSGCLTEPPSLQTPVCTTSRTGLRFREGEEDPVPHESRLAQGIASARAKVGETSETSRDPPAEDSGKPQGQDSQHDPGFAYSFRQEEEEDDDRESVADLPPPDKTYTCLVNFIHERFPHSRPSTAARLPPRCEFEDFFSITDPAPTSRQNITIYPRVSELVDASANRASRLARESRASHRVVPLKRKMFYVGDQPDYCAARFLNLDFSPISKNKNILKIRASSVTLADLEKLDRGSRTILAGDSQCFWLLSSLLAQLKDEGYHPADPALFDRNISALSAALALQTTMAADISDFITSKRQESYLAHASCPIAESVNRDLLVSPGSTSFLFDQLLLEKVVASVKEDSIISSTASLASLSKAA